MSRLSAVKLLVFLAAIVVAFGEADPCTTNTCPQGKADYFFRTTYKKYWFEYYHNPNQPAITVPNSPSITTAVIVIHGLTRNVNDYLCWMNYAVAAAGKTDSTYVLAPHYYLDGDILPNPMPAGVQNIMSWSASTWLSSGTSSKTQSPRISSFTILDDIITNFVNKTLFPGLKEIVLTGHSAGGQAVHRYALTTQVDPIVKAAGVKLRYVSQNGGSYAYLDANRANLPAPSCTDCADPKNISSNQYTFSIPSPTFQASCTYFNDWKIGLNNGLVYVAARSADDIRAQYPAKDMTYVLGEQDNCNSAIGNCVCPAGTDNDLDTDCDAMALGTCRFMRGWVYYRYLAFYYGKPTHKIASIPGIGHNGCGMINHPVTRNALFPGTGLSFSQTLNGQLTNDTGTFSQWQVTANVGQSPLYTTVFQVVLPNQGAFAPWNINLISGQTNFYQFPTWQYPQSGVLPAGSSSISFGYTINGTDPADISLHNNAFAPEECPLTVTPQLTNSWGDSTNTYQQYILSVQNIAAPLSTTVAANVQVQINFYGGAYISSSYNIIPQNSAPGATNGNFTCSLWNLSPGGTSNGCGYFLVIPTANLGSNQDVFINQGICIN